MEKIDIDNYRENIDTQLKEKFTEIDNNISLITIGSLGFFITILDKFVDVKNANLIFVMVISFLMLSASFVLFLYHKHLITNFDRQILHFLDEKMKPNDSALDKELLGMWTKFDGLITKYRNLIYISLAIGVVTQVFFLTVNIMKNNKQSNSVQQVIKIELTSKDTGLLKSVSRIYTDTIKTK